MSLLDVNAELRHIRRLPSMPTMPTSAIGLKYGCYSQPIFNIASSAQAGGKIYAQHKSSVVASGVIHSHYCLWPDEQSGLYGLYGLYGIHGQGVSREDDLFVA